MPVGRVTLGSWDTSSAGEKVSARRLGTNEKTMKMKYKISTHARAHTCTHKHSMGEREHVARAKTTSHHDNTIITTAVCLTSTSGPKPLLLAKYIASSPCDTTHTHTHTQGEG